MRELLLVAIVALCASGAFAENAKIILCQEKDRNCQVIPIDDAKKVEKISNGAILRITFSYGKILDIQILGKTFEIKKDKKKKK